MVKDPGPIIQKYTEISKNNNWKEEISTDNKME